MNMHVMEVSYINQWCIFHGAGFSHVLFKIFGGEENVVAHKYFWDSTLEMILLRSWTLDIVLRQTTTLFSLFSSH